MIYEKTPPQEISTLTDVLKMVARLGGFLGRKHDGDPGPTVMRKGMRNLYEYIKPGKLFKTPTAILMGNDMAAARRRSMNCQHTLI